MKSLKAICATVTIALALGVPAYAGDVQTPGKPLPVSDPVKTTNTTPETTGLSSQSEIEAGITVLDILWALASLY
jgi:hypothetical protein